VDDDRFRQLSGYFEFVGGQHAGWQNFYANEWTGDFLARIDLLMGDDPVLLGSGTVNVPESNGQVLIFTSTRIVSASFGAATDETGATGEVSIWATSVPLASVKQVNILKTDPLIVQITAEGGVHQVPITQRNYRQQDQEITALINALWKASA
jgi:hypothetical protein